MKPLTVKELKEVLSSYPEDMIIIVTDIGKSHDFPIYKEYIQITDNAYSPDGVDFDDNEYLQLARI